MLRGAMNGGMSMDEYQEKPRVSLYNALLKLK